MQNYAMLWRPPGALTVCGQSCNFVFVLLLNSLRAMAKAQSFVDKVRKAEQRGKGPLMVHIIKGYRSERGTVRFLKRFVRINDLSELDTLDITKDGQ